MFPTLYFCAFVCVCVYNWTPLKACPRSATLCISLRLKSTCQGFASEDGKIVKFHNNSVDLARDADVKSRLFCVCLGQTLQAKSIHDWNIRMYVDHWIQTGDFGGGLSRCLTLVEINELCS